MGSWSSILVDIAVARPETTVAFPAATTTMPVESFPAHQADMIKDASVGNTVVFPVEVVMMPAESLVAFQAGTTMNPLETTPALLVDTGMRRHPALSFRPPVGIPTPSSVAQVGPPEEVGT